MCKNIAADARLARLETFYACTVPSVDEVLERMLARQRSPPQREELLQTAEIIDGTVHNLQPEREMSPKQDMEFQHLAALAEELPCLPVFSTCQSVGVSDTTDAQIQAARGNDSESASTFIRTEHVDNSVPQ